MCQAWCKGFGVTKTSRALPQGLVKDKLLIIKSEFFSSGPRLNVFSLLKSGREAEWMNSCGIIGIYTRGVIFRFQKVHSHMLSCVVLTTAFGGRQSRCSCHLSCEREESGQRTWLALSHCGHLEGGHNS